MGVHPDLVDGLADAEAAIDRALDLTKQPAAPLDFPPPTDFYEARQAQQIVEPIGWWLEQMRSSPRLIEERLVWFWHDHFATSLQKVRAPYLMYRQHLTIREHATGSFAELLHAMAKDPAMLVFLDGITNSVLRRNENFGREVMELFTVGRGEYTQDDVVAASRAFTGWVVNIPGRLQLERVAARFGVGAWQAGLIPRLHDGDPKTLLGKTGAFDLDGALDVLLDHPTTAPRLAAKLYAELVGHAPDDHTAADLGRVFRSNDWKIMPLVEAIVADPAFTAANARNAKVRTPLEKLVGLVQAVPGAALDIGRLRQKPNMGLGDAGTAAAAGVGQALRTVGYVPFVPPNVGGYPKGTRLLGPNQLVHTFDLLSVFTAAPKVPKRTDDLLARFGLYDAGDRTRTVLDDEPSPTRRLALVLAAPEYLVV